MDASKKTAWILAAVGLMLGLLAGFPVLAGDGNEATIENRRDEIIVIKMTETLGEMPAETIMEVQPGQTISYETSDVDGEVCAYRGDELEQPEKLGCRTLEPGETWVIE